MLAPPYWYLTGYFQIQIQIYNAVEYINGEDDIPVGIGEELLFFLLT